MSRRSEWSANRDLRALDECIERARLRRDELVRQSLARYRERERERQRELALDMFALPLIGCAVVIAILAGALIAYLGA